MEVFEVTKLDNNLQRIKIRLKNEKGLPTMTYQAIAGKIHPQDMLKVSGVKVIASGRITDLRNNRVTYQEYKQEIIFTSVPGYGYVEYQFLVEGKGEAKIEFISRKAKDLVQTVKL